VEEEYEEEVKVDPVPLFSEIPLIPLVAEETVEDIQFGRRNRKQKRCDLLVSIRVF
jgi:hypothetical protein